MQTIPINKIFNNLSKKDNFVFLETKRTAGEDNKSYLFTDPIEIISCMELSQVENCLNNIETKLEQGYFAAGFISYEAGLAFEDIFKLKGNYNFPFFHFGIYKEPTVFDHKEIKFTGLNFNDKYSLKNVRSNITKNEYTESIKKIKAYIEKGDTYQVNYTFKLKFSHSGSAFGLYNDLRKKQSVSYSSLMRFDKDYLLSFSPELFFRKKGNKIEVKPMKGTIDRGRFRSEDIDKKKALYISPKDRSENIMIVDLLRNDLGRICKTDTVKTKKLFGIEDYESLFQMTSTIEGRAAPKISVYDLFKAMFPSGSVTGAPKIRTMQIIDEIEKEPRKVYTGSIGFITPKRDAVFNVAIRTILIDAKNKKGEMGIGSGVVYDSDTDKEYDECKLKAKFLTDKARDFELIETIRYKADKGYPLINLHLERLSESAAYFNFPFDKKIVSKILSSEKLKFNKKRDYRLRLLLNREGELKVESAVLKIPNSKKLITLSSKKISSDNVFLFHKTTNRKTYNSEYKKYSKKGFYDIIFQNEKNQITEGAISNIFIKKHNIYYTPPIESGVLNGVYRRHLMRDKKLAVKEKVLYKSDIESADDVFLTSAIRGIVRVKFSKKGKNA